jgi:hypothetical protein
MSLFVLLQTALGTPGLIGLFALVAFVAVYVIRKKFGPQWERLVAYVPVLGTDLTPGSVILSKFVQALPGALVAAVLGAVTSGASLGPTLLAALGGLLAAAGHEFAKWLPIIPYRGEVGEEKLPGAPKVPTGIAGLMLALSLFSCGAGAIKEPCSTSDKAAILGTYSVEFAERCAPYNSMAECPFTKEIQAKRDKELEKCR